AQKKEEGRWALRQVRLDRLAWGYDGEGGAEVAVHGISISPREKDDVGKMLEAHLFDVMEKERLPKPKGKIDSLRREPSPFSALRLDARTANDLAGLLLADSVSDGKVVRWVGVKAKQGGEPDVTGYDKDGKLQLRGFLTSEKPEKEAKEAVVAR